MSKVEDIEKQITNFLLRDVVFFIEGGKTLKKGKLVLFKFKEFYFNFALKNDNGDLKNYEVPYPFAYKFKENSIEFSYSLDDFTLFESNLFYKIKTMNKDKAGKLYDSTLVLSAV